jgi:Helix-turn-helix domain/RodZ C-terminal domain
MSLADVAAATNIRQSYLESLENDDPLEAFPAPVYERYFLREYARFLGVEEESHVKAAEGRLETVEPGIELPPPAVPPPRRWVGPVLAVAAVGGLIFLAVTSFRSHPEPRPSTATRPPAAVPRVAAPSPTPTLSPAHRTGIQATLRFAAPSWVQATVDGKILSAATYPANGSVSFHGRRTLELILGNAGGVDLRINGKHVRTGQSGQVITLYFVWRNGRVSSST